MSQQTETRRIIIKMDTSGSKELAGIKNQFKELNKTVKESNNTLGTIKNMFQGLFAASIFGVGIQQLTQMADSYQKLSDRISVFEGSQAKAKGTMENLAIVADRTRTSIDGIATVYSRLALSLGDTGISSSSLLFVTEQLQNSFRLAGATAAEATSATIQLSQGLASGTLRGQELRSVLESNAVIGELLAKKLGAPRGQLLKLAEAGKITADVFLKALATDKVDKDVQNLGVTFAEAADRGINKFKIAIGELNRQFGLSKLFDTFIQKSIENLSAFGAVLLGLVAIAIPSFIAGLSALGVALKLNPITLAIGALVTLVSYVVLEFDRFSFYMKKASKSVQIFALDIAEYLQEASIKLMNFFDFAEQAAKEKNVLKLITKDKNKVIKDLADLEVAFAEMEKKRNSPGLEEESFEKRLAKYLEDLDRLKFAEGKAITGGPRKELEQLNAAFNDGQIGVAKYNSELLRLTEEIYKKKGPAVLAEQLRKVNMENLTREFEAGSMSLTTFNEKMESLKITQLKEKLDSLRITQAEYNKELLEVSSKFEPGAAIYTGVNNYIESAGTLSQNIAKNITLVFNTLEDTLVEFVKTGKFEFRKFATAVLDDLTRIIMRAAIIQPLAKGILGLMNTDNSGKYGLGVNANGSSVSEGSFAKGGAFIGGVQYFAKGGIVDRATTFGMRNGLGVMGEAGPEAIMPLRRGPDGSLGVEARGAGVVVNIVNNSGAEIQQTETTGPGGERVLDILITNKTKELFANGAMDKTMKQSYGLQRRGV